MSEQGITMNEKRINMTYERWNKLVGSVRFALEQGQYKGSDIQDNEIDAIVSVLKNNIPFNVVSGLNNNEVKL